MSKMEFILQALTYPQIGKIIYRSAHSDLNQAIADFKSVIAQHVSAIVTYPDFGDAMMPVFKEATKAGIPVVDLRLGLRHRARARTTRRSSARTRASSARRSRTS